MNRHQRRAEAAKARVEAKRRREAIAAGVAYLAACANPDVVGATLILPSGETLYLSAEEAAAKLTDRRPH